jgi:hypothetical protein
MQALSVSKLLEVWEQGQGQPPYWRAILLLATACPGESLEGLSQLSIGSRDARLLTLREWTFGRRLDCLATCPACAEHLEFSLEVPDLQAAAPEPKDGRLQFAIDGYTVEFRPLNTSDLMEAIGRLDDKQKPEALMERCVLAARRANEPIATERLPAQVLGTLAAHMAQADPQADIQLPLACPTCDHRWRALFDIVSFFWSEIHAWAVRMLREVHLLASAYGWREAEILAMSPVRRGLYLEMAAV